MGNYRSKAVTTRGFIFRYYDKSPGSHGKSILCTTVLKKYCLGELAVSGLV